MRMKLHANSDLSSCSQLHICFSRNIPLLSTCITNQIEVSLHDHVEPANPISTPHLMPFTCHNLHSTGCQLWNSSNSFLWDFEMQFKQKLDMKIIAQLIEGSLEVKLPTIWTDEKQSREEAERRERLEERRSEEKRSEERRCRCAKR